MISLNLLPPAQKKAIDTRVVYALLERLMMLVIISVAIVTIVLVGVRIQLQERLAAIRSRQILTDAYVSANSATGQLNATTARVEALEKLSLPVSNVLFDVFARVPTGIRLDAVSYDARGGTLSFSGAADTRAHLLALEGALRGSPYVKGLESPISNLFGKTDISFTMQASINPRP